MVTTTNPSTVSQTVALYDALRATIDQRGALCILYNTDGKIERARVILPERIQVGPQGSDLLRAWDSIRKQVVTFRLDRVVAWHALPVKNVA